MYLLCSHLNVKAVLLLFSTAEPIVIHGHMQVLRLFCWVYFCAIKIIKLYICYVSHYFVKSLMYYIYFKCYIVLNVSNKTVVR